MNVAKIVGIVALIPLIMAGLLVLLLAIVITLIYVVFFLKDCLFGNWILKAGDYIGSKFPKIKDISVCKKIWRKIQIKEMYIRYETPAFAFCCSVSSAYCSFW